MSVISKTQFLCTVFVILSSCKYADVLRRQQGFVPILLGDNQAPQNRTEHELEFYFYSEQGTWLYNCEGEAQSPTMLFHSRAVYNRHYGHIIAQETLGMRHWTQTFNHRDYVITIAEDSEIKFLFNNEGFFRMYKYQLHWSNLPDEKGSQHAIEQEFFQAEVNFYFYKCHYETLEAASKAADGLIIMAVLIRQIPDTEHDLLESVMPDTINGSKTPYSIFTALSEHVPLSEYYVYSGSLPYPDCSEPIRWVIFPLTATASATEFNKLRMHKFMWGDFNNLRDIQPMNQRTFFKSFEGYPSGVFNCCYRQKPTVWYSLGVANIILTMSKLFI